MIPCDRATHSSLEEEPPFWHFVITDKLEGSWDLSEEVMVKEESPREPMSKAPQGNEDPTLMAGSIDES